MATTTGGERRLKGVERRRLAMLGLPALGLALAITTVSSYLPVVASEFTGSTTVIGVLIGGEGLMALFVPLLVGTWSDRLRTPIGGRLPFVLAGTPVLAVSLIAMGVVRSLAAIAIAVAFFFVAYFVVYEPYRALYPDLFEDQVAGRAQGNQAVWRGGGTILALGSGGVLLSAATFLPFAVSAAAVVVAIGTFSLLIRSHADLGRRGESERPSARDAARRLTQLIRRHPVLRAYLVANALWELSLGALKTFVVLYVTKGLGYSLSASSLIVGTVAIVVVGGALASGMLGDRLGRIRTMHWGLIVYGTMLAVPVVTASPAAVAASAPVIAFGGGMVMSLPYALLMPLMPEGEHGLLTGFYAVSRGIGTTLGPLLAGIAVQVLHPLFEGTDGYAAMWLVCSASILASIPMLSRIRGEPEDRRELRRS